MKNGLKFGEATLTIRVETLETAVPADTVTEKRFKEYYNLSPESVYRRYPDMSPFTSNLAF